MSGETVHITDDCGKPLVPEAPTAEERKRVIGSLKGVLHLPPGWDPPAADTEILDLFEDLA